MKDASFGIIPLKKTTSGWKVLAIFHQTGFWAFPKGHADADETPFETASRELLEETNLQIVKVLLEEPFVEQYTFRWEGKLIFKTVTYFAAEVKGKVVLQADEVADSTWVPLEDIEDKMTYPEAKRICRELKKLLG